MCLTRLAFWCLPNPRFTRCLGGFGPKLVPSLAGGFLGLQLPKQGHVPQWNGVPNEWLATSVRLGSDALSLAPSALVNDRIWPVAREDDIRVP